MKGLLRFAGVMGPLSSLFDVLTFGVLLFVFHASPEEFRTAWFLESMATQILVIFIIRTNGRPWHDRPGTALAASSLIALVVALAFPFTPLGPWFGFNAARSRARGHRRHRGYLSSRGRVAEANGYKRAQETARANAQKRSMDGTIVRRR